MIGKMHFCITKGTNGSPNLWNQAFTEERMEEEMVNRSIHSLANKIKGVYLDKYGHW